MVTLEEIYQKYFDCKVPFRKNGRFTESGAKAHEKLVQLFHDLESLGVIDDARFAELAVDEIAGEAISTTQEMINDLLRFITMSTTEYRLLKSVTVTDPEGKPFKVKFLSLDVDYHDIFMTEIPWHENFQENIFDFSCLKYDDAVKVFEAIVSQEIETGWDWQGHAYDVLTIKFPEASRHDINDFIMEHWQDLKTDADNIESFQEWLNQ